MNTSRELFPSLSWEEYEHFAQLRIRILIPGYSQLLPFEDDSRVDVYNPEVWQLNEYQLKNVVEEHAFLIYQIKVGLRLQQAMPWSKVVFSGGCARMQAGDNSEGKSYWIAAQRVMEKEIDYAVPVAVLTYREESFDTTQNMIEVLEDMPDLVVGWQYDFKQPRMRALAELYGIWNRYVSFGGMDPIIGPEDLLREERSLKWVKADPLCVLTDNPEAQKMDKRNWKKGDTALKYHDRVWEYYNSAEKLHDEFPYLERAVGDISAMMRARDPLFAQFAVRLAPWLQIPAWHQLLGHRQPVKSVFLTAE